MTPSRTLITLSTELGATLSQEEADQVKQLFYDALGEFISARGGVTGEGPAAYLRDALKYVRNRYPGLSVAEQQRKAEQVILRKQLARKLRAAASNTAVVDLPKSYLDEMLASLRDKPGVAEVPVTQEHLDALFRDEEDSVEVVPIAERACVVLPTVFAESVEEEAERFTEEETEHLAAAMRGYQITKQIEDADEEIRRLEAALREARRIQAALDKTAKANDDRRR